MPLNTDILATFLKEVDKQVFTYTFHPRCSPCLANVVDSSPTSNTTHYVMQMSIDVHIRYLLGSLF